MRGITMSTRCALAWSILVVSNVAACGLTPPSASNGGGQSGSSSSSKSSGGSGGASSSQSGGQSSSSSSAGSSGGQSSSSSRSGGSSGGSSTGGTSGAGGGGGGSSSKTTDTGSPDAGQPDLSPDTPALTRGPTPKQPGVNFPFPQNRELSRCIYPKAYRNEDVQAAYDQWKRDTVTSDGAKGFRRVMRTNEPGTLEPKSTVSEGIAYGMLMAVFLNDQPLFDDLWQYEQQFLDGKNGLMHWYIKADGSGPAGTGAATDADEDMAYALVMADKQWGSGGKLKYLDLAKDLITKIWNNEIVDYKYVRSWPGADTSTLNPSYFAPAYYKLFAKIDTKNATNWNNAVDALYTVINASLNSANGNTDNGLVPAWCDAGGKPNGGAFGPGQPASPTNYQYDSCRVPFRVGLDWCMNGEPRAQAYLAKTSKFFGGIGASKIVDGYDLNGTPKAQYQKDNNSSVQSAAFVGPAAVGAMSSSSYQSFVDEAYSVVATRTATVGGIYYDESWTVLSLLMMSGNFLDYTTYTP